MGLISQTELTFILKHLHLENSCWIFENTTAALLFSQIPMHFTEFHWGSPFNTLAYSWTAEALKRAIELELITVEDMHLSTDDIVWRKLISSKDAKIRKLLFKAIDVEDEYCLSDRENFDLLMTAKFKGIDPLVKTKDGLKRLTELDVEYAQKYYQTKTRMTNGIPVKLTKLDTKAHLERYLGTAAHA